MRVRFVGYEGVRPPVPGTTVVTPEDPPPPPVDPPAGPLVVVLENGVPFTKSTYLAMGYNRFDVICIGGAGGRGGGYRWSKGVQARREYYGGGGGGGGIHRIKGRLSLLPTSCPVVVGAAGADAPFIIRHDNPTDPLPELTSGAAGGMSSFNNTTCRASGGMGGGPVFSLSGIRQAGLGGAGGIGNVATPGGNSGNEGVWNGTIGSGGRGGDGGHKTIYNNPYDPADPWTYEEGQSLADPGFRGAYLSTDPDTSGPGGPAEQVTFDWVQRTYDANNQPILVGRSDNVAIIPGAGGGATAFQINGENLQYGSKYPSRPGSGLVIIRLTYQAT